MLIIDSRRIPGTERVREAIAFEPGHPNTRRFRQTPRAFGLHWTGAENRVDRVAATLRKRRLSVHFGGEANGEIVQLADVMTRCAHIGSPGNDGILGMEMVSRGFATKADLAASLAEDPTLRDRSELDWGEARDTYRDTIGGREVGMVAFAPRMIENMLWLAETLAGHLGFPRQVPARRVKVTDKLLASIPLPDPAALLVEHAGEVWLPDFSRDPSPRGRALKHRGVLGHFHVHPSKCDPGTQPFYALWAEGWNPASAKLPRALAGMY